MNIVIVDRIVNNFKPRLDISRDVSAVFCWGLT